MINQIRIKKNKGRCVFAAKNYIKGDIIEIAPVIVLQEKERLLIENSNLDNYYFEWGSDNKKAAIVLGHGSIYNHSQTPNAQYQQDKKKDVMKFVCIKDIKMGKEILVNYYGNLVDNRPVWFELGCSRKEWNKY